MAKKVTEIAVFVSCPDDVMSEKKEVGEVCDSLSSALSGTRDVHIRAIDWKKDVTPLITGESAQSVINTQIKNYDYDIYVGILWKRFGDKLPNGLTPTEVEFEDAFDRYQRTKKPILQFYFKLKEFYPDNPYDANQAFQVQEFKERRIKPLGIYCGFRGKDEFRNKLFVNILKIIEKFDSLNSNKTPLPKIKYYEITQYLSRKICSVKDYESTGNYILRSDLAQDTIDVISR